MSNTLKIYLLLNVNTCYYLRKFVHIYQDNCLFTLVTVYVDLVVFTRTAGTS